MILLASNIPNDEVNSDFDTDDTTQIKDDSDSVTDISDELTKIIVHQQLQIHHLVLHIIQTITKTILIAFEHSCPISYYTSIFTGQGWILELLNRHPKWIYTELGIHLHVFNQLMVELQAASHTNSRHICYVKHTKEVSLLDRQP